MVSNGGGSVTSTAATLTVSPAPIPPSITTQPASTMAFEPSAASFSVVATGNSPLNYQWLRNGSPISGATGTSHRSSVRRLPVITARTFSVVVSNVAGSVTSSAATLSVFGSGSGTVTLLEAHFDSDADGFAYVDDTFRNTNQARVRKRNVHVQRRLYDWRSASASGRDQQPERFEHVGRVEAQLHDRERGASGAGVQTSADRTATYETDEFTQTLVTLDGVLRGLPPNDYIAQVVGGGPTTTGWQLVQIDLGTVPAGTHVLTIGAYNNKKSYPDEFAEVLVDDVLLMANPGSGLPV